jgi:hypothetical protein
MSSNTPEFFVPAASPESAESVYAGFAKMCGVATPSTTERVYSVTFKHDRDIWTATVGETMTGTRHSTRKLKGRSVETSQALADAAMVLAIFPGDPFMVVTNHRLVGNTGSRWENPFLAGRPESITHFSTAR